jgi:hypothetical protein
MAPYKGYQLAEVSEKGVDDVTTLLGGSRGQKVRPSQCHTFNMSDSKMQPVDEL